MSDLKGATAAFQFKAFYIAYLKLKADLGKNEQYVINIVPCLVNGIFASELALKTLLLHRRVKYDKIHDLMGLLELLPDDLWQEIMTELQQRLSPLYTQEKIVEGLFHITYAFTEWRYLYENRGYPIDSGFADAFVTAICDVALRHHDIVITEREQEPRDQAEYDQVIQKFIDGNQNHLIKTLEKMKKGSKGK